MRASTFIGKNRKGHVAGCSSDTKHPFPAATARQKLAFAQRRRERRKIKIRPKKKKAPKDKKEKPPFARRRLLSCGFLAANFGSLSIHAALVTLSGSRGTCLEKAGPGRLAAFSKNNIGHWGRLLPPGGSGQSLRPFGGFRRVRLFFVSPQKFDVE